MNWHKTAQTLSDHKNDTAKTVWESMIRNISNITEEEIESRKEKVYKDEVYLKRFRERDDLRV